MWYVKMTIKCMQLMSIYISLSIVVIDGEWVMIVAMLAKLYELCIILTLK